MHISPLNFAYTMLNQGGFLFVRIYFIIHGFWIWPWAYCYQLFYCWWHRAVLLQHFSASQIMTALSWISQQTADFLFIFFYAGVFLFICLLHWHSKPEEKSSVICISGISVLFMVLWDFYQLLNTVSPAWSCVFSDSCLRSVFMSRLFMWPGAWLPVLRIICCPLTNDFSLSVYCSGQSARQ